MVSNGDAKSARRWPARMVLAVSAGLGITLSAVPAEAIPSPELVVGSISGLSQLAALVSALLGGGALAIGARAGRRGRAGHDQHKSLIQRLALPMLVMIGALSEGANLYLWIAQSESERARLEATLLRSTPKNAEGKPLDPALRETSYAHQQAHERGISTDEVAALFAKDESTAVQDVIFLDIREPAEAEMGTMPSATSVRFPDLATSNLKLDGKTVVLFCHNGNRSSETCAKLAARGIDCRFIVGGLEKWLVEGRQLAGENARTMGDLRALPSYPNQTVLLTTTEVKRLRSKDGATFVDVRYPGEFASGHLPGAVNLPIRPTPTDALQRALSTLPNTPIVAPCYDRRSCFYAEILGLLVTRLGRDFRGRYTEPWAFVQARTPPPHVQAWMAAAQQGTFSDLWGKGRDHLTTILVWLAGLVGLPLALAMLATASRLIVLPFAVKSDRDSMVARTFAPQLADLKARLKNDPRRRARAIQQLYKTHNLTPLRNMIALLFLPVLAVCIEAVSLSATLVPTQFLWINDLSAPDPYFVLPVVFAGLLGGYLDQVVATKSWHRLLVWMVGAPLLGLLAAWLPAASGLYLVVSALLLIVQRLVFFSKLSAVRSFLQAFGVKRALVRPIHAGVFTLADPTQLENAGNKARRLAILRTAGIDVPSGLVLTDNFLGDYARHDAAWQKKFRRRLWRAMASKKIAVRSSATGEDGAASSFAGVFETVLDVDANGFEDALEHVLAAFQDPRTRAYGSDAGALNILLQPMVPAVYAGVIFTEEPASAGSAMIELVEGCGDDLVSGRVAPQAYRFGRVTSQPLQTARPPIDLAPLLALGHEIEEIFGKPQDIEWAYANGRFMILQSRDITTLEIGAPDLERAEWRRILGDVADGDAMLLCYRQNEMAEMLPRPTPLSLSLLEAIWQPGGSMDQATARLSMMYGVREDAPPLHVTLFGRLYVDKREERRRATLVPRAVAKKLRHNAEKIETQFRGWVLPEMLSELRQIEAIDLDRLSAVELVRAFADQCETYLCDVHVEIDLINVAAHFYLEEARQQLGEAGQDVAMVLADLPPTYMAGALQRALLAPKDVRDEEFRRVLGARAVLDYELAAPRHSENKESLDRAVEQALDALWRVEGHDEVMAINDRGASPTLAPRVAATVARARRFQTLKEDAKHHALRVYAVLRQMARAIDTRFGLGEAVFFLNYDEIMRLSTRNASAMKRIAGDRKAEYDAFKNVPPLPSVLTAADIEKHCVGGVENAPSETANDGFKGTWVSGSHASEGRLIVVPPDIAEVGGPIDGFQAGDIIATSMVHPAWLPEVVRSGGVISMVGGWLSHMSIIAREHDVAMIIGVTGIETLVTGDQVRLETSGDITVLGHGPEATGEVAVVKHVDVAERADNSTDEARNQELDVLVPRAADYADAAE